MPLPPQKRWKELDEQEWRTQFQEEEEGELPAATRTMLPLRQKITLQRITVRACCLLPH
jgi:hypothetical protein